MTTTNQKQEILRSLQNLDAVQSEKVLEYIRELLKNDSGSAYHHYIKRKAMREIGQALRQQLI